MEPVLTTIFGVAGGSITTGWIAKFLIQRFLKQNDKKHEEAKTYSDTLFKKLDIVKENQVDLLLKMERVLVLKEQIVSDHDTVIALKEWNGKYKGDLIAQFVKIKDIEDRFEGVSKLISTLRREAENDGS